MRFIVHSTLVQNLALATIHTCNQTIRQTATTQIIKTRAKKRELFTV